MAKILIIDDDPAVRKLVSSALSASGHETLLADGGKPGMEMARSHLPDLVISDVEMPHMDGRAFLAWLRNDPATSSIPTILMTGHVDKTPHRVGMNLGADDYLAKPFPIADLLAAVSSRLQKQEVLQQATQRKLAELSASLSAAMPSELLTPLGDILSRVEILRLGAGAMETDELLDSLGGVELAANRLQQSLQAYLFHAEVELMAARPDQIDHVRHGQTRVSQDVVSAWALTVAERLNRGTDLILDLADCPAPIDTSYLARATEILLEHAFLHCPPATTLKVSTRLAHEAFSLSIRVQPRSGGAYSFRRAKPDGESDPTSASALLGVATIQRFAELLDGSLDLHAGDTPDTAMVLRLPISR